jgi:hypothetical protein
MRTFYINMVMVIIDIVDAFADACAAAADSAAYIDVLAASFIDRMCDR